MKSVLIAALLAPLALTARADETGPRQLIYLHGRIIQDQQIARPRHPEFGYYELEKILATFRERDFVVTGEIRPKGNSLGDSADHVVDQLRGLLAAGVPARRITVVGGSMGAAIALLTSVKLQNPDVNFCVLAACMSRSVPGLRAEHGQTPVGRILAFREASDETSEPCPAWSDGAGSQALVVREIVLHTGLRHGFLYRPLPEWVEPVVEWAKQN